MSIEHKEAWLKAHGWLFQGRTNRGKLWIHPLLPSTDHGLYTTLAYKFAWMLERENEAKAQKEPR
jgi:hypothetical protein